MSRTDTFSRKLAETKSASRPWTSTDEALLRGMWNAGMSTKHIVRTFGIPESRVRGKLYRLRESGWYVKMRKAKPG